MDKVIWTEGLFLRPQHFQQMERYLEHYAHAGRRAAQPFCWGFETLSLDEQALSMGSVVLREARGLLPDGTPVRRGMKSGDVDPRDQPEYCATVSDKARAIGGGVLEALCMLSGGICCNPVR